MPKAGRPKVAVPQVESNVPSSVGALKSFTVQDDGIALAGEAITDEYVNTEGSKSGITEPIQNTEYPDSYRANESSVAKSTVQDEGNKPSTLATEEVMRALSYKLKDLADSGLVLIPISGKGMYRSTPAYLLSKETELLPYTGCEDDGFTFPPGSIAATQEYREDWEGIRRRVYILSSSVRDINTLLKSYRAIDWKKSKFS